MNTTAALSAELRGLLLMTMTARRPGQPFIDTELDALAARILQHSQQAGRLLDPAVVRAELERLDRASTGADWAEKLTMRAAEWTTQQLTAPRAGAAA